MDAGQWPQVRAILESALSKPDSERSEYVEKACGHDDRLRHEVLSYLSAEQNASRLDFALVCQDLSDIAATGGNRKEALDRSQQAIALLDPPAVRDSEDVQAALQAHARIAWLLYRLGEYPQALAHYERYGAIARDFYGTRPVTVSDRRTLAFAEERTGDSLARMGRFKEGVARLTGALVEYQQLEAGPEGGDLIARDPRKRRECGRAA